jgi:hypothetical protein
MSSQSVRQAVRRHRDASAPCWRRRDLRKGSSAADNPKIMRARLGHATVAFTLDTYTADVVPELHHAAAVAVSDLFLDAAGTGPPSRRSTCHTTNWLGRRCMRRWMPPVGLRGHVLAKARLLRHHHPSPPRRLPRAGRSARRGGWVKDARRAARSAGACAGLDAARAADHDPPRKWLYSGSRPPNAVVDQS